MYTPTPEDRRLVELMAATKTPRRDMVRMIIDQDTGQHIDYRTLVDHFDDELSRGATRANLKVAANMLRIATADETTGAVVRAGFKWLACNAGWHDVKFGDGGADTESREEMIDSLESKIARLAGGGGETIIPFPSKPERT